MLQQVARNTEWVSLISAQLAHCPRLHTCQTSSYVGSQQLLPRSPLAGGVALALRPLDAVLVRLGALVSRRVVPAGG